MFNISRTFALPFFLLEKIELRAVDDFLPHQMNTKEKTALNNTLNFYKDHNYVLNEICHSSYWEANNSSAAEWKSEWKTTSCDSNESHVLEDDVDSNKMKKASESKTTSSDSNESHVPDDGVDSYPIALPFNRGDKMETFPSAFIG